MPARYLSDPELARLSGWPGEIADEDAVTYFTRRPIDLSWLRPRPRAGPWCASTARRTGSELRCSCARCRGWAGWRTISPACRWRRSADSLPPWRSTRALRPTCWPGTAAGRAQRVASTGPLRLQPRLRRDGRRLGHLRGSTRLDVAAVPAPRHPVGGEHPAGQRPPRPPARCAVGGGTLSSSDGQRFPQRGRSLTARALSRYFLDGTTTYTYVSDQHSTYGTKVIPTT